MAINRPYQIGIAVYQLAKLQMLEFHYDFLDKYVARRDYELIQMDTDSSYMALSAPTLDELVKPHKKVEYEREKRSGLLGTNTADERRGSSNSNATAMA